MFSHKPTVVSMDDDGAIKHNGTQTGLLYYIAETVGPGDAYPHPNSSMTPGKEWLTARDLRLELIGPVEIVAGERLTKEELTTSKTRLESSGPPDRRQTDGDEE